MGEQARRKRQKRSTISQRLSGLYRSATAGLLGDAPCPRPRLALPVAGLEPLEARVLLSTVTSGPAVAMHHGDDNYTVVSSSSGFVAAWVVSTDDGGEIHAQRYSAAGAVVGKELRVDAAGQCDTQPVVVVNSDGAFAISWVRTDSDGESNNVYVRPYSAKGDAVRGEMLVGGLDGGYQAIAMDARGDFVVAWQSGTSAEISAQAFTSSGAKAGEVVSVAGTADAASTMQLVMDRNGKYVAGWVQYASIDDTDSYSLHLSSFALDGTVLGNIEVTDAEVPYPYALAMNNAGELGVVYGESNADTGLQFHLQTYAADGTVLDERTIPNVSSLAVSPMLCLNDDGSAALGYGKDAGLVIERVSAGGQVESLAAADGDIYDIRGLSLRSTGDVAAVYGFTDDNGDFGAFLHRWGHTAPTTRIKGSAWVDEDGDGARGADEGLSGLGVQLLTPAGDVVGYTFTESNGAYRFEGMPAGRYIVQFVAGDDYVLLKKAADGVDARTFKSASFPVGVHDAASGPTSGFVPAVVIDGSIDANSRTNDEYSGLDGWTVYLDLNHNGKLDKNEPTETTAEHGHFRFSPVVYGTYTVAIVPQGKYRSLPADLFSQTLKADPDSDRYVYFPLGGDVRITGTAWVDENANGVRDNADTVLAGVGVVFWWTSEDGTTTECAPVLTRADGSYTITSIDPGSYFLRFKAPDGFEGCLRGDADVAVKIGPKQTHATQDVGFVRFARVSGTLTALDGTPLAGWNVSVSLDGDDDSEDGGCWDATTDEFGRYTVEGVAPGTCHVSIMDAEGQQAGDEQTITTELGVTAQADFSVEPPPRHIYIAGKVTAPDGTPLAGWNVFVDDNGDGIQQDGESGTVTDENGDYSLDPLLAGTWVISTSKYSWLLGDSSTLTSEGGSEEVDFSVTPPPLPAAITGTIATPDGDALYGWYVFIDANNNGIWDDGEVCAATDENGAFGFDQMPAGTWTIAVVDADGYATGDKKTITLAPGDSAAIDFSVTPPPPPAAITGTLMTPAGVALSGWCVFIDANGNGIWDDDEIWVSTDETGAFGFVQMPAGTWTIAIAEADGYATGDKKTITLAPGDSAAIDFAVIPPQPVTITGTVTLPDGTPLPGAYAFIDTNGDGLVNDGELCVSTDSEGRFCFDQLRMGTWTIAVADCYWQATGVAKTVTLGSGEATDIDLAVPPPPPPATIAGTVTTLDGSPLAWVYVYVDANGNGIMDDGTWTFTDETGHFSFDLLPAGTWTITIADYYSRTIGNAQTFTLAWGEGAEADFAVPAPPLPASISGAITFPAGTRLWEWKAFLDTNGNGICDGDETTTSIYDNGCFQFNVLLPGTYVVAVAGADGVRIGDAQTVTLASDDAPDLLFLLNGDSANTGGGDPVVSPATGSISGIAWYDANNDGIRESDEPVAAGVQFWLDYLQVTTAADGSFSFTGLELNREYTLYPANNQGIYNSVLQRLTANADQPNIVLSLPLVPSTTVSGTLYLDSNGDGVRNQGESSTTEWRVLVEGPMGRFDTYPRPGGAYLPLCLTPGDYTLTPLLIRDSSVAGTPIHLHVADQPESRTLDIALSPATGSIIGIAYLDLNRNGIRDAGEGPARGMRLALYRVGGSLNQPECVSGDDGSFAFVGVLQGSYAVEGIADDYWTTFQTVPVGDSQATAAVGLTPVTRVSGHLFVDSNGNGVQDLDESAPCDWKIVIDGAAVDAASIDANGWYTLALAPGEYDLIAMPWPYAGGLQPVHLTAAEVPGSLILDFAVPPDAHQGTVSGTVWIDANGNGIRDEGEGPAAGMVIECSGIYQNQGLLSQFNSHNLDCYHDTVETDADGNFSINNLPWGYHYLLATNLAYKVNVINFTIDPSHTNLTCSIGLVPFVTVRGTVYTDTNANGVQDSDEPGSAGWAVNVTGPGGGYSARTDADGHYQVYAPAGAYRVEACRGGVTADYLPDPIEIVLVGGQDASADFALLSAPGPVEQPGTLSGIVYDDANGNGVQDLGELPLPGVIVTIDYQPGPHFAHATFAATTDATGHWSFAASLPGTYRFYASNYTDRDEFCALPVWLDEVVMFQPTPQACVERQIVDGDTFVNSAGNASLSVPASSENSAVEYTGGDVGDISVAARNAYRVTSAIVWHNDYDTCDVKRVRTGAIISPFYVASTFYVCSGATGDVAPPGTTVSPADTVLPDNTGTSVSTGPVSADAIATLAVSLQARPTAIRSRRRPVPPRPPRLRPDEPVIHTPAPQQIEPAVFASAVPVVFDSAEPDSVLTDEGDILTGKTNLW